MPVGGGSASIHLGKVWGWNRGKLNMQGGGECMGEGIWDGFNEDEKWVQMKDIFRGGKQKETT